MFGGFPLLQEFVPQGRKAKAIGDPLPIYFSPQYAHLDQPGQIILSRHFTNGMGRIAVTGAFQSSDRPQSDTMLPHGQKEL